MGVKIQNTERYLNTERTARMLDKAPGTLANDRFYRRGLPYIKARGRILYDIRDIVQYLEENKIRPND